MLEGLAGCVFRYSRYSSFNHRRSRFYPLERCRFKYKAGITGLIIIIKLTNALFKEGAGSTHVPV